ncbi:hypothetical protein ACLOJK_024391 [Asimina triloba]
MVKLLCIDTVQETTSSHHLTLSSPKSSQCLQNYPSEFLTGVKVSSAKDPKMTLIEVEDGQMIEVEDALPLRVVLPKATGLVKPWLASEATKLRFEAKGMEASGLEIRDETMTKATVIEGPKATVVEMKVTPAKGSGAQIPKKVGRACDREQAMGQAKVVEHEAIFAGD